MNRPVCSAAPLHHDQHHCRSRWYFVTDPDGNLFDFCSAACLLHFAVYGLRVDVGAQQNRADVVAPISQERTA